MEPMALGSPSGSPLPSTSGYLPSFLMGDTPTTPRTNTLSPTKGRTSLAFTAQSPVGAAAGSGSSFGGQSLDFGHGARSTQKFTLGGSNLNHQHQSHNVNHNSSVTGPPTQGLFDSFRNEKQLFQTPSKNMTTSQGAAHPGTPGFLNQSAENVSSYMLNTSGFNVSRVMSPIPIARDQDFIRNSPTMSQSHMNLSQSIPPGSDYWITVFGFPISASSMILSHFSHCGAIIEKVFATQNGNWVHLRFTSRLECDKALNYNGKIIGQNLMIGVQYCNDPAIVGKENSDDRKEYSLSRVRSLTHIAYKNAQHPTDVVPSPTAPTRSSGLVNKAMDLIFGW